MMANSAWVSEMRQVRGAVEREPRQALACGNERLVPRVRRKVVGALGAAAEERGRAAERLALAHQIRPGWGKPD